MERKQIYMVLAGVLLCLILMFTGLFLTGQIGGKNDTVPASANAVTTQTTEGTTTPMTTTVTTTTTTVTTLFQESLTPTELETLHAVYEKNIVVVGDSIAYGFNAYEYISDEQNLAQGSIGIRNIHDFTFSYDGEEQDYLDILKVTKPDYIYMSMGMNDVNMSTAEEYIESYEAELASIREICPNSNIVIAGITPVTLESEFTDNANIREFNEKLKALVKKLDEPSIAYFDAYSILADPDTQNMKEDCSGGDGIHLASKCYRELLDAVYPILDTMPIPEAILEQYTSYDEESELDSEETETSEETTTETEDELVEDSEIESDAAQEETIE